LSPEFVEILGLDVPDEPERRRSAVKRCLDFESHLLNYQGKGRAVANYFNGGELASTRMPTSSAIADRSALSRAK